MFYDSNPTCGDSFVMQYFQMPGFVSSKALLHGVEVCKLLALSYDSSPAKFLNAKQLNMRKFTSSLIVTC